jgi:hypothetical protein
MVNVQCPSMLSLLSVSVDTNVWFELLARTDNAVGMIAPPTVKPTVVELLTATTRFAIDVMVGANAVGGAGEGVGVGDDVLNGAAR